MIPEELLIVSPLTSELSSNSITRDNTIVAVTLLFLKSTPVKANSVPALVALSPHVPVTPRPF